MPAPDANVRKMSGCAFRWLATIQAMCFEPPRCGIAKLNRDSVRCNRWRQYVPWARVLLCTAGSIASVTVASAQAQTSQTLTLVQAIELARANYPSLKEV